MHPLQSIWILDRRPNPARLVIASTPVDLDDGLCLDSKSQELASFNSREGLRTTFDQQLAI